MNPFRDDAELVAELREIRPTPEPGFAARLDARAAAGFPRESRWSPAIARIKEKLSSTPRRRLIAPVAAVAVAAIAISTAVVAMNEGGETSRVQTGATTSTSSGGSVLGKVDRFPKAAAGSRAAGTAAPSESSAQSESSAEVEGLSDPSGHATSPAGGPYASHAAHRDVERAAEIVLGAEPSEVRADSAKVFEAVHAADGIVLHSSIRDGEAGDAGADFELLIPSGKVGDALASFSSIAAVRSRHESSQDITAPTIGAGERLQDARATVSGLLGQLAGASTDEERAAVEAELRSERYRVASLRSRLASLQRRSNFSKVSLRIQTGEDSSTGSEGGGGGWGVGDGIDDAGGILAIAGGVTAIGLALLAPFALIALLTWLARRAWLIRARRNALRSA